MQCLISSFVWTDKDTPTLVTKIKNKLSVSQATRKPTELCSLSNIPLSRLQRQKSFSVSLLQETKWNSEREERNKEKKNAGVQKFLMWRKAKDVVVVVIIIKNYSLQKPKHKHPPSKILLAHLCGDVAFSHCSEEPLVFINTSHADGLQVAPLPETVVAKGFSLGRAHFLTLPLPDPACKGT